MNYDLSLFDPAPIRRRVVGEPAAHLMSRTTDPESSKAAAASVNGPRDRDRAFRALAAHPEGLTDFELGDLIGRGQTSAGKRRLELQRIGLVEFANDHRPAPSGAMARVWKLTAAGLVEARNVA